MGKKPNPYPYSDSNKRYYTYDCYLRRRFGGKVIKIPLDAGFTCPNLDGTRGRGGCIYCSHEPLPGRGKTLREQFESQRAILLGKWGREGMTERYLPYFQVFTNTYAPTDRLRSLYEEALSLPGTVGLCIATRADCLSNRTVALLRELSERTYLTVELGLQTTCEETAKKINRCHTYAAFLDAWERLDGLNRCVHLINGLPGENRETMLQSAKNIAALHPHEVKLHMLYIETGTQIYEDWRRGEVPMLSREEYVSIVCDQLEQLPPDTVIGRLTGDGTEEKLVAPEWSRKKMVVMNEVDKELVRRDSWQGKQYRG